MRKPFLVVAVACIGVFLFSCQGKMAVDGGQIDPQVFENIFGDARDADGDELPPPEEDGQPAPSGEDDELPPSEENGNNEGDEGGSPGESAGDVKPFEKEVEIRKPLETGQVGGLVAAQEAELAYPPREFKEPEVSDGAQDASDAEKPESVRVTERMMRSCNKNQDCIGLAYYYMKTAGWSECHDGRCVLIDINSRQEVACEEKYHLAGMENAIEDWCVKKYGRFYFCGAISNATGPEAVRYQCLERTGIPLSAGKRCKFDSDCSHVAKCAWNVCLYAPHGPYKMGNDNERDRCCGPIEDGTRMASHYFGTVYSNTYWDGQLYCVEPEGIKMCIEVEIESEK